MKFGELISKNKHVLIIGHDSYKNLDRDLITDLKIEHDVFIATLDLSIHPVEIVQHIKHSDLEINCMMYSDGKFVERHASKDCNQLENWISKIL